MKKAIIITILLHGFQTFAQNKFTNCAAAFLNNKMIVEKYEPKAKAYISKNSIGELTVCTANISEKETIAVDKILFSVAIKDGKTDTILLVSKKPATKYNLSAVLTKCKKGDSILLLTDNEEYALPHNEILVE